MKVARIKDSAIPIISSIMFRSLTVDPEAKEQLLRRFSMIDAIAFRSQIYFKEIVFVSSIPNGTVVEERVPLPWEKRLPMDNFDPETVTSWSSAGVCSFPAPISI